MTAGRYEVRFAGAGGPGIALAALILAEAVTRSSGTFVCQTQSYGPEARGGVSIADVVVSTEPIDYPKPMALDLLAAMDRASCDAHLTFLKPTGLLLVDETFVEQPPYARSVALPFTRMAREELGKSMVANMVALGAVGQLSGLASKKNLEAAVAVRVPQGLKELNLKALRAGIKAARKLDLTALPELVEPEEVEV